MFYGAEKFDNDISNWDITEVQIMKVISSIVQCQAQQYQSYLYDRHHLIVTRFPLILGNVPRGS